MGVCVCGYAGDAPTPRLHPLLPPPPPSCPLSNLISRITFGAKTEVLPLCEIPYIQTARARILFRQGYTTVEDVAGAKEREIARILDLKPER